MPLCNTKSQSAIQGQLCYEPLLLVILALLSPISHTVLGTHVRPSRATLSGTKDMLLQQHSLAMVKMA
jgi:hypothetical protein